MAINDVDQEYDNPVKQEWRESIHSLLTSITSFELVDKYGNYKYKVLELVAKGGKTFAYLLSTGKITEDKLIGLNNDKSIIQSCKVRFPDGEFIHSDWNDFCLSTAHTDIGIIIFDSCYAGYGKEFEKALRVTLNLVVKSLSHIGECMLVINVDGDKTYRGNACNRTEDVERIIKAKMTFCDTMNNIFCTHSHSSIRNIEMLSSDICEYKQNKTSATMLSCNILFR